MVWVNTCWELVGVKSEKGGWLVAGGAILIIAAVIFGVVFGDLFKVIVEDTLSLRSTTEEFNWVLMLGIWISGAVVGCLFIGLGQLITIAQKTLELHEKKGSGVNTAEKLPAGSSNPPPGK